MILQNDTRFDPTDTFDNCIIEAGCYVFDWLFFANKYLNIPLSISEIRTWIKRFQGLRTDYDPKLWALDDELYLNDPNVIARALGFRLRSKIRAGEASELAKPGELEFLWWYNPTRINPKTGKGYHHMTAGNGSGVVVFDSLGKSHTVAEGYIEAKRFIGVIEAA